MRSMYPVYNDSFFYKKCFFVRRPKYQKSEAHGFIYKIASRMLLTITHDYPCYPTEQLTKRTRYAHGMALVTSQDLIDRDIWDLFCQPLQVLLDHLIISGSQPYCLECLPLSMDGICTWRLVRSYIYFVKEFLISRRSKNIKNISYFKIYKNIIKTKCVSYPSSPTENLQAEPSLGRL
jgi:hypothetical protein